VEAHEGELGDLPLALLFSTCAEHENADIADQISDLIQEENEGGIDLPKL